MFHTCSLLSHYLFKTSLGLLHDLLSSLAPTPSKLCWDSLNLILDTHPSPGQVWKWKGFVILSNLNCMLVHYLFMTLHDLFKICLQHVLDLFTICSWLVHELFTTCSKPVMTCSWIDHSLFLTCSQLIHNLFMTCSWPIHYIFIRISLLVHYLFFKNKAFVTLGSCDNVQTERSIFEYANWPKLRK